MNTTNLGAVKTQNDLIKIQFTLPADEWIIQIVPEGNQGRPIRDIVTRQKLFSAEQVSWFRALNANGCHIYGRPNSTRYVLIDDVQQEGIIRFKQDGLVPTASLKPAPTTFKSGSPHQMTNCPSLLQLNSQNCWSSNTARTRVRQMNSTLDGCRD